MGGVSRDARRVENYSAYKQPPPGGASMSNSTFMACLARLKSSVLGSLTACLSPASIELAFQGHSQRHRIFHPVPLLLTFLNQTLHGLSCQAAVADAKLQRFVSKQASPKNAAYCNARAALPEKALISLTLQATPAVVTNTPRKPGQRPIKIVDGSSARLADTAANQKVYPQNSAQPEGCGWPLLYFVVVMALETGAIIDAELGSQHEHERCRFLKLWPRLRTGDILVADGGYDSFVNFAGLRQRGIDLIAAPGSRYIDPSLAVQQGHNDWLVTLHRPSHTDLDYDLRTLPADLPMRLLCGVIRRDGFRDQKIWVLTTLTDPVLYPAAWILHLYCRRWTLELRLRDLKDTMSLAYLQGRTPAVCRKEVWMRLLIYNLVRALMVDAAQASGKSLDRLSFKLAWWCLRRWMESLAFRSNAPAIYAEILHIIASTAWGPVRQRIEPRGIKGHTGQYEVMHRPRAEMRQRLVQELRTAPKQKRNPFEKPKQKEKVVKKSTA